MASAFSSILAQPSIWPCASSPAACGCAPLPLPESNRLRSLWGRRCGGAPLRFSVVAVVQAIPDEPQDVDNDLDKPQHLV
jgi:hypothetical protein